MNCVTRCYWKYVLLLLALSVRMSSADDRSKNCELCQKFSKFKFSLPYFDLACKMHSNECKEANIWSNSFKCSPCDFVKISSKFCTLNLCPACKALIILYKIWFMELTPLNEVSHWNRKFDFQHNVSFIQR